MKRVAYCLYGQPRMYQDGERVIGNLINKYRSTHQFDFFFHVWYDEALEGTAYPCNPYRKIPKKYRLIKKETIDKLIEIYGPRIYIIEKPINFDLTKLKESIMYHVSNETQRNNLPNVVSNLYSKYRVCQILTEYMQKNNIKYDFIASSRFDISLDIDFDLNIIDPNITKLYCRSIINNEIAIRDNIIFATYNIFKIYSETYLHLEEILNDQDTLDMLDLMRSGYLLCLERLVTGQILMNYPNFMDVIEFRDDIPEFTTIAFYYPDPEEV